MHFSEAALFSLLEFIFRSCGPYNLLLRIDVNFPLWIDLFFFSFLYMGAMKPKLQQIGYLPVLKMHLNRLVKSLL